MDLRAAIERLILSAVDTPLELKAGERAELQTLYQPRGYQPLWMDPRARPTDRAR